MAQADGVVANGTGSAVRSDINNQYAALWSNHSGSTEPSSGIVAYQFWADTNTNVLRIRNSANNAWINLFTLAGGLSVDSASTFNGTSTFNEDVTFDGATAGRDVVWDRSDNALEFADNAKCILGTGGGLEIYFDGSNSILENTTGSLYIRPKASEAGISLAPDGAVKLYFNNSKKLETSAYGTTLTGNLFLADSSDGNWGRIKLGGGEDLELYHDSTDSKVFNHTGTLLINSNNITFKDKNEGDKFAKFIHDAEVEIYYDGTKKFNTTSGGCYIHGNLYPTSDGSGTLGTTGERWQQLFIKNTGTVADLNCNTTGDVQGMVLRHARGGLSGFSGKMISFQGNDSTEEGSIVIGTTTTAYNTSSDYRLKENQVAISDGITRLKTLKPYRFNFKKDKDTTVDGFFAHEVTPAVPEAIYGTKDATNSDGSINPQQIDQSKLVPLLTAALQEAITKIETLETKVAALEAK